MNLKNIVRADYQECVSLMVDVPSELKAALRTSERVPAFIDKLAAELEKSAKKVTLKREDIKQATYSLTEFFVNNFKKSAERKAMSDLARMVEDKTKPDPITELEGVQVVDREVTGG